MHPSDTEMVRVFTRNTGEAIGDVTLPADADFEVAVDVEAGDTIFGDGTDYLTGIVVRDITNNTVVFEATTPAAPPPLGDMGDADWPTQRHTFVYTVPQANLAGKENHFGEVIAFLRAGVANPDVSFATSPMFIIE